MDDRMRHSRRQTSRSNSRSNWNVEAASRRSIRAEEDEEALRWAALEKLPTYDRLRKTILKSFMDAPNQPNAKVVHKEIDVRKLDINEKQEFIDRFFKVAEEDNEKFLLKQRQRIDKVGITLPTVEVRFEHLTVEADCFVGDRALPTLLNTARNIGETALGYLGIRLAQKTKLTILKNVSGIIKPSRMTLLLGPPSSGKTTLLLALAGKLDPTLKGLSCKSNKEQALFTAVQSGDLDVVKSILDIRPNIIHRSTAYDCNSALHIAAANGQIEVLSYLLEQLKKPDLLNRHKQTPLMLAAMHGKISCVKKLIEAGANILMFDSINGRTCLHYAAYYGHSDCLQVILSAAQTSQVAASWGYARFVNVKDRKGATPLHLAARQRRPGCVHMLLENGALVCASTGGYGFLGSTPLHLAARSGSLDCIRELLAWGADRLQRDASGRIPYTVALRKRHGTCAALLNPSSAEPIVWPSSLKFISELNHEAKALLECALMEANKEREDALLKRTNYSMPSPLECQHTDGNLSEEDDAELCGICFDQACTIEVQECGHLMCAQCTLALCCHNKPDPATASPSVPVCPFCRSSIVRLVAAKANKANDKTRDVSFRKPRKSRKSRNLSEGSSSFKGLSAIGSFRRLGFGSGRIVAENEWLDKPLSLEP